MPDGTRAQANPSVTPKDPPATRHAFQFVLSSVIELDTRAHHLTSHCLTHQHLARSSQVADSPGDGHCQASDVVTPNLDLARVHSRPQLQPEVLGTGQDVGGAAKRSAGGVKGGQEAIPGRLHLMPTVAGERSPG